jgi:predicted MPP superfamily phosphohydrolase
MFDRVAVQPVAWSLFALACLGHLALMVTSHNWWYGQRMGKRLGDLAHLAHGLLFLSFPVALYRAAGWDPGALFDFGSEPVWRQVLAGYVVVCWVAGLVGLPAITLARLLRREPVIERRSEVLDVARELGYPPLGNGKQRFLARLPFNEVFQLELAERTLRLPRLPPAFDGLTVLHVSDLHLSGTPDRSFYRLLVDRCNAWQPDLVAVTGDIADSYFHQRWIVPVLGRLRWEVAAFAILGNHDYWYDAPFIRRRLRRLGMHVLSNTWVQVEVRGQALVVIGHEGPWGKPPPDLAGCPAGPFRLCLSHTPDNIAWARRSGVDLMLSGHVHGGQIRLPVIGSVLVPSRYGRRYDCGTFNEPPTVLHVSRGLSGEHPLRYLCRPEVTRLVLRGPQTNETRMNAD